MDVKILNKLAYVFTGFCSPGQHTQVQCAAYHCIPWPPSAHATQLKAWHKTMKIMVMRTCFRYGASVKELLSRELAVKLCYFSQILVVVWVEKNHPPFCKSPFEVETWCHLHCLEAVSSPAPLCPIGRPEKATLKPRCCSESFPTPLFW